MSFSQRDSPLWTRPLCCRSCVRPDGGRDHGHPVPSRHCVRWHPVPHHPRRVRSHRSVSVSPPPLFTLTAFLCNQPAGRRYCPAPFCPCLVLCDSPWPRCRPSACHYPSLPTPRQTLRRSRRRSQSGHAPHLLNLTNSPHGLTPTPPSPPPPIHHSMWPLCLDSEMSQQVAVAVLTSAADPETWPSFPPSFFHDALPIPALASCFFLHVIHCTLNAPALPFFPFTTQRFHPVCLCYPSFVISVPCWCFLKITRASSLSMNSPDMRAFYFLRWLCATEKTGSPPRCGSKKKPSVSRRLDLQFPKDLWSLLFFD